MMQSVCFAFMVCSQSSSLAGRHNNSGMRSGILDFTQIHLSCFCLFAWSPRCLAELASRPQALLTDSHKKPFGGCSLIPGTASSHHAVDQWSASAQMALKVDYSLVKLLF